MPRLSFFDPSVRRRLRLGAWLAVAGLGPALPDVVRAATGGRYQGGAGGSVDLWARAALTAGAWAVAMLLAAVGGPLWRRRRAAGALAALCAWPPFVAAVARDRPGPFPIPRADWLLGGGMALVVGVFVVARYPGLAERVRAQYIRGRARQIARRRDRIAG